MVGGCRYNPGVAYFCGGHTKNFCRYSSHTFSSFVSPLLVLVSKIERPVVWTLERISWFFVSLFSGETAPGKKALTEDEFKTLIDVYQKEGGLEEAQRDLIHRVFGLADKPVSEIMIPRVEMFCLPISLSMAEMEAEIIKARHTRIPIYGSDRDDILGILFARDLISGISGEGGGFMSISY